MEQQTLLQFLKQHGYKIMLGGFGLSAVSILVYYQQRFAAGIGRDVAFATTIAGFVVYLTGRIFHEMHRREAKARLAAEQSESVDVVKEDKK